MSDLTEGLENYLLTRRALGFKLVKDGRLLADFVASLDRARTAAITIDAALTWATEPAGADPSSWAARLSVVRGFASWWAAFDPATQVPPKGLLPAHSRRAEPYPYTGQDIAALMGAARVLRPALRGATYETLIGLLSVTGMRIGEAIRADRPDLDPGGGVLSVRDTKFGKSRELALHPSTLDALATYVQLRERLCPRPVTTALFVSTRGTRLLYQNVHLTWLSLVKTVGLRPLSPRCRPRPHDLRHRFAVNTLLNWYRTGQDVTARMPQLSTYLGHTSPTDTYWYLRAAPELLALAADRLETGQAAPR